MKDAQKDAKKEKKAAECVEKKVSDFDEALKEMQQQLGWTDDKFNEITEIANRNCRQRSDQLSVVNQNITQFVLSFQANLCEQLFKKKRKGKRFKLHIRYSTYTYI